jgi:hypothetical protein
VAAVGFGAAVVFLIEKNSAQNSANSEAADIANHGGHNATATTPGSCNPASSDYSKFAGPCATLQSDNDNVNTDALIGNVALGVGIAATAFTVGYWMFAWKGEDASAASAASRPIVAPMIGKGTGGLTVGAAF